MKTFTIALVLIGLLAMTAPPLARSVGPGVGGGGHFGGMARGGVSNLNPAGGGGIGRGGAGNLNPAGPFNQVGPIDREGFFDHGARRDHNRGFRGPHRAERFAYPVCFAYAYCPSAVWPCAWQEGYWTAQPDVDEYGAETLAYAWIPPGCY